MLQARSNANAPNSSVKARIHQTILFRFHFWISVAMIVMRFPPFMVPIIKGKPCHNLAEKNNFFKKSSVRSQSFRKYDGKYCSSFKDTVCRDGSFMDAYQFLSNGEAQPVPFGRSGVIALIHPLKDMGEISSGNPFPVISHYDFCLLLR